MYSRSLVFAQFALIGLIIVLSQGLFSNLGALVVLGVSVFFGLWVLAYNRLGNFNIRPELKEGCVLITTGPYKFVRHPMYTAVMLFCFAFVVATPNYTVVSSFALLFLVLGLKAVREEGLWCAENEAYRAYMKVSKRFIPFIY